jgi:GT2 family glycosyltransferase
VRAQANRGFGASVNTGVRETAAEFVLVLNSDTSPGPRFVRDLMAAALPHQPAICGVTLVEHGVREVSGHPEPRVRDVVLDHIAPLQARRRRRLADARPALLEPGAKRVGWVGGAALLVPRAAFDSVGGFDEGFHMYWEDTDLQTRLADAGVPAVWLADIALEHASGTSSGSEQKRLWDLEGQFRYFALRGRTPALTLTWGTVIATNFGYDVARRVTGRDVAPVTILRERLRHLRAGIRSARRVRRER